MDVCHVVLADDHALIRRGIRKMIEEDERFRVIGEAGDGLELLDLLRDKEVDLAVVDISMPNLRGIEAIEEARKIRPDLKILILSMHKSEQYLCSAMQAGAHGYLLKEDSDAELLPAMAQVMAGEKYISPFLTREFRGDLFNICRQLQKGAEEVLSPRERQILKLVAEGWTSRDIAEKLSISRRTVEHHRASIMRKLDAKSTADLIKYAMGKGYIVAPQA